MHHPLNNRHKITLAAVLLLGSAGTLPAIQALDAPVAPPKQAQQTETRNAREILGKVIDAYGGLSKLKETKEGAFKGHGTFSTISGLSGASNDFECDLESKDEQLKIKSKLMGQTLTIGYDGKDSWQQLGDWVSYSTETTAKRFVEELKHGLNALIDAAEPGSKLELLPDQTIQGKLCDVFRAPAADGKPTTFYADKSSHIVLRTEFMGTDHEQGVPALQSTDYMEYRPIHGTLISFKSAEYTNGKKTAESVLDKMDPAPEITDADFRRPPESEVARVKEGAISVPFQFVNNEIIVPVRINNKYDYKFIVDTGASQCVLDKEAASAIGPYSTADFSITAGAKAMPLSYMTMDSFRVGDCTLDSIPALVTDLSAFQASLGHRPAGLLGASVLRRFLVTIDFPNKKLILADPKKVTVPPKALVVPTSPTFGSTALVVSGKVNDKHDLNFLVDTGAAFNNLPRSLAKPLMSGQLLPVGKIFGLDGEKLDIGMLKLNNVKLGPLTLEKPVFALSPDTAGGAGGLFGAGAMGILGNPIWSQFCMTVDYKGERLFLEPPSDRETLISTSKALEQIQSELHSKGDLDKAIATCHALAATAKKNASFGAEALATAMEATCYSDKYLKTRDAAAMKTAVALFPKASQLAQESKNANIQAKVTVQWADMYLAAGGAQNLAQAQPLLTKAAGLAPTEPEVFASFGNLLVRAQKFETASKILDQALMFDPSNWKALWSKYAIYQSQGQTQQMKQVAEALRRYYPNAPQVVALSKTPAKVGGSR